MIAVLAAEVPRLDELGHHLESAEARCGRLEGAMDARPWKDAAEPCGQRRAARRRGAGHGRGLYERDDADVAPSEGVAVEVRSRAEGAVEIGVHAGALLAGARLEAIGELAGGAAEDPHLEDGPVDGLVVRVADLLEQAHPRALRSTCGQQRGRRPAILEV